MSLKNLNIDLGCYLEALRKKIWWAFFSIRGHNAKYHDLLKMLCPSNWRGFGPFGYDRPAVTTVVGLVHSEQLLDNMCYIVIFDLGAKQI